MSEEPVRLFEFRGENFKGLSFVRIIPKQAVTQITGKNGAGKTSTIDLIEAIFGGGNSQPEMPIKKGRSRAVGTAKITGMTITRKWTKSGTTLEIVADDGSNLKSPQ